MIKSTLLTINLKSKGQMEKPLLYANAVATSQSILSFTLYINAK